MNNKGKGILAILGAAAGAFAFWKYKNMTNEEKQNLKNKVSDTGRKIRETAHDVEDTIQDKYNQLKKSAKNEVDDVKG